MSNFATLKLTAAVKPTNFSPVQLRREKMSKRLQEQIDLAKAQQTGAQFNAIKMRSITDKETGLRKFVETSKRVKQWWFTAENRKLSLSVRYGARLLELAKGKFAVELASDKELVTTLELIQSAVLSGELDAQIEIAANKLRSGFKR
jgi:hypothetical protein